MGIDLCNMKNKVDKKWIVEITVLSFLISVVFSFASSRMLDGAGYVMAFAVLAIFILVGIVFDMIGVAVTSATEAPLHSMASHREPGAAEALDIVRNAEKVASICNDVVGDISGIISGTTAAVLAARLVAGFSFNAILVPLVLSGVVAGTTIGGKAAGKTFGMKHNTQIVLHVGRVLHFFHLSRGRNGGKRPRR